MMRCTACGRLMRQAWLTVAGRSYGPTCGRPLLVRVPRAKRKDSGVRRGPRPDDRQLDLLGEV